MERFLIKFLTPLFAFFLASSLFAQQNFPVKVSGNMVPPNSVVLSDYTGTRAQDIMLVLTLTDPVEPSRAVRLKVTVLHNGAEILVTNPNYLPPPINIANSIPEVLDGTDIAGYLNPANLLSINGQGQPTILLPAGDNSICIEVIDALRNVPVSERFCINRYFDLAQPPLLNLPACGTLIPFSTTSNIMFSWTPMHLLSPNPPTNVSYEFTLVKLFPGVTDPNDGFSLSTIILQKTVYSNSLIYTEADPPLEQDALYAWRVRAIDGNNYDLFINHGYSQICSFAFENGGQLGSPLYACEGGNCSYSEPISSLPLNSPLEINDEVKVGFFNMKLTSISPSTVSENGFTGTGTIYIPFLFSKLIVHFDNLEVNRDRRMSAGEIHSVAQLPGLIPPLFSSSNQTLLENAASQVATGFADNVAAGLTNYFNSTVTTSPPNIVSILKDVVEANAIPIGLPIGIDQQVPGTDVRTTVAVTDIVFTPRQANLNVVLAAQWGENGNWVKFGAKGLCFQPGGLAISAPSMMLLSDVALSETGIPLTIKGMSADGTPGTYLSFNCEGFEEFVLKGSYDFNRDYVRPVADPEGQVKANFTITTKRLDDFMVKVDALDDFFINGAEDFPFQVGDIWLDFSKAANPQGLTFPDNYPSASAGPAFRGIYITQAGVTLPAIFAQSGGGALPNLTGLNLLFDGNGMTGHILGNNLIDLSTGDLGGWKYSLDSAWLNITANTFVNSGFKGRMQLPVMSGNESLKYSGFFQPGVDASGLPTGFMDFGFRASPDTVTINLLRARIIFDPTSEITIGRLNGQFQSPRADLSGLLTTAAPEGDPGFAGHIMDEIQAMQDALESLGLGSLIPKFNIDGIRFEGMKIDLAAEDKFQIESIIPQNAGFQFLGFNADLSTLNFNTLSAADLAQMSMPSVQGVISRALKFKLDLAKDLLGAACPSVIFSLVINENSTGLNTTNYSFGGFDIQFVAPDVAFDCNNNIPAIAIDASPANFLNTPVEGYFTTLKTGHFTMKPQFPLSNDNGHGLISGVGTVDVDILGPFKTLSVQFSNVQVDQSGRIVAGEVITGGNADMFDSPDLGGILSLVQSQVDAMVSGLNQFSLPVVLGKKANGENERDQGLILMGLVFGPQRATARAKVIFDTGNEHYAEFVADGLNLVPNGIANFDLAVGLASDFEFQPFDALNPLVFKKFNPLDSTGSFIRMDCRGFLEFNLEASYSFSQETLVSIDHPATPVTGTFTINTTKWGDFLASMTGMGSFSLPGMEGFSMSLSDAWIDFSKERNIVGIQFPENYNDGSVPAEPYRWRGFFMPHLSITLPPEFTLSSSGASPTLTCENMLIDEQGMSFTFFGNNLIDGEAGGWGFALDSLGLRVVTNDLVDAGLAGNINIPLLDDPMGYVGMMEKDVAGFWSLKLHPQASTRFNITALHSYIDLEPASEISLGTIPDPANPGKRKFKPYANLYGKIGLDVERSDFPPELNDAVTAVEGVLGAPFNFVPPAISLYGLKINHPDLPSGKTFGLDAYEMEGSISIGSHTIDLQSLRMLDSAVTVGVQNFQGLGLEFSLDIAPFTAKLSVWAKKDPLTGKYGFGKVDFDFDGPTLAFDCNNNIPPIAINAAPSNFLNGAVEGRFSTLKTGHFNLKPVFPLISDNNHGLISGNGTVDVDILGPFKTLDVQFTDVQVDQSGRIVSGEVITGGNTEMFDSPDLGGVLSAVQSQVDAMVNGLNNFSLPIVLGKKADGENERDQGLILMGLVFGPQEATARAKVIFDTGNDKYIEFVADGLTIVPNGIANFNLAVGLASDFEFQPFDGMNPLVFKKYDNTTNTGSFIKLDCQGFVEFNMAASYSFSEDMLVSLDHPETPVTGTFVFNTTKWGDFMASMQGMGNFSFPGMEGFSMNLSDAWIDYSKINNVPGIQFPENYADGGVPSEPNRWRGFYMPQLSITLPSEFALSTSGRSPSLTCQQLLIDQQGMSFSLFGNDLVDGSAGGWGFALDSLGITVVSNTLTDGGLAGSINLPLLDSAMQYVGMLEKDDAGYWALRLHPKSSTHFSISALHAYMDLEPSSEIVLGSIPDPANPTKRKFKPYANLYGKIGVDVERSDFPAELNDAVTAVEDVLGAPFNFVPPAISLYGLKINHPDLPPGKTFGLDAYEMEGSISIGSHTLDLESLRMLDSAVTVGVQNFQGLGLQFNLDIAPFTAKLGIWAKKDPVTGRYSFGKLQFEYTIPEVAFDCNSHIPPISINTSPSNFATTAIEGRFSTLKTGQFILKPTFPLTSDNGHGLISGSGTIDVNILGPFKTLSVQFTNVQVDQTGRIVAGEVITGGGGDFESPDLGGVLSGVQSQVDAMISGLNNFSLPVVLGKKANGENERDQGLILMGLVFGPQEATARAKVIFDTGNGKYIEFVADGLAIVPNGIANFDLAVGLANDFEFQPFDGLNPLVFKKYDAVAHTGSFISMDCRGFLEFNLQASYSFSQSTLVSLDHPGKPVTGTFTINTTKWGDFMASMQGMGNFTFPGLDGFNMSLSDAWIDFSKLQNVPGIQFPENYADGGVPAEPNRWRGFYMPHLSITLPPEFALSTSGRSPTMTCNNMIIDNQGMSFALFGTDLIDGASGGWGFALDSLGITVVSNNLMHGGLAGAIDLPLLDSSMQYVGRLEKDAAGFWAMKLHPTSAAHFSMPALHSYMDLQPTSVITLATVPDPARPGKRKFKPYAELYGKIGVTLQRSDFPPELNDAITTVENALGIPAFSFVPPAISLYGLKINHPSLPAGTTFGLDAYEMEGNISFGSHVVTLEDLQMVDSMVRIGTQNFQGLELAFNLDVAPFTAKLGIWAKKDPVTGRYSFGKVIFEINAPQMQCVRDPLHPSLFAVNNNTTQVMAPFLASTYNVQKVSGSPNFTTGALNPGTFPFSLMDKLQSIGNELPFDLGSVMTNLGLTPATGEKFDFIITGITFKPDGTATMNAELRLGGVSFVAAMPIHPYGIYFDEIKIGPGQDVRP